MEAKIRFSSSDFLEINIPQQELIITGVREAKEVKEVLLQILEDVDKYIEVTKKS